MSTLFKIVVSPDSMLATIPAKTPISQDLKKLNYNQFCVYLQNLGYKLKPTEDAFKKVLETASKNPPIFEKDFELIKGTPFSPPKPATIKWLNPHTIPKDLLKENTAFAIIKQAQKAILGCTIFGKEFPMSLEIMEKEKKLKTITLHENYILNDNGEIKSKKSGQAIINSDGHIDFSEIYQVKDVRSDHMKKVEFPCDVLVKCDLQGNVDWIVHGNLKIEQFWSAPGIFVHGNVQALSGIQLNNLTENTQTQINGNLEANFIQSSCILVEGNIKVEKAILASRITLTGNLECFGEPGKISGSEIVLRRGFMKAKSVGSEKEKSTLLKFLSKEGSDLSKIDAVSDGTRIIYPKFNTIIKYNQPWPPPK